MTMSYSYKPVFILAFLDHMDERGQARIEDVVQEFASFYERRLEQGKAAEKRPCIFTIGGYTDKDVERLILSMPFKPFEDMNFMHHARHLGIIQMERAIFRRLESADIERIRVCCWAALRQYFGEQDAVKLSFAEDI